MYELLLIPTPGPTQSIQYKNRSNNVITRLKSMGAISRSAGGSIRNVIFVSTR